MKQLNRWHEALRIVIITWVRRWERADFPVQHIVDELNKLRPELEDVYGRERKGKSFDFPFVKKLLRELEADGKITMKKAPGRRYIQVREGGK
jgi:hypothetical protein